MPPRTPEELGWKNSFGSVAPLNPRHTLMKEAVGGHQGEERLMREAISGAFEPAPHLDGLRQLRELEHGGVDRVDRGSVVVPLAQLIEFVDQVLHTRCLAQRRVVLLVHGPSVCDGCGLRLAYRRQAAGGSRGQQGAGGDRRGQQQWHRAAGGGRQRRPRLGSSPGGLREISCGVNSTSC